MNNLNKPSIKSKEIYMKIHTIIVIIQKIKMQTVWFKVLKTKIPKMSHL